MEEKKQIKINLKTVIIMICISIIVSIIAIYLKISHPISNTIIVKKDYKNEDYYIIEKDYKGDYDLQFLSLPLDPDFLEVKEVMNYEKYKSYCNECGIKAKYTDFTKKYIVFSYLANGSATLDARLAAVEYNNKKVDIYIWDAQAGCVGNSLAYVLVIPTYKNINSINIVPVHTYEEYLKYKDRDDDDDRSMMVDFDKPIIYLYPTKDTEVSLKLLKDENITCSYPKYKEEWKVLAHSNGNLKDLNTNKQLYALYYESKNSTEIKVENEGFVVKGEDTISFLEEKLDILGLTEREAEEFIVYWLPKLQNNKYNYIRFATTDEINENMPLEIDPSPDTIIRILMIFKKLENPINVQEQKLEKPNRTGFVAVEWGGTEIK